MFVFKRLLLQLWCETATKTSIWNSCETSIVTLLTAVKIHQLLGVMQRWKYTQTRLWFELKHPPELWFETSTKTGVKRPPKLQCGTAVKCPPKLQCETAVKHPPKRQCETAVKHLPKLQRKTAVKCPPKLQCETAVKCPPKFQCETAVKHLPKLQHKTHPPKLQCKTAAKQIPKPQLETVGCETPSHRPV